MNKLKAIVKLIGGDPEVKRSATVVFGQSKLSHILSDKLYLKIMYKLFMGKKLDLKEPKTFNEKLQWLKIYDRNPEHTTMVDKHAVKKYVADIIGEEYIIPTLGVWNNADDIDFDSLPEQFVLKCTHDSKSVIICKNKSMLNIESTRRTLNKGLKTNLFYWGREWPYKNVPPRIIAEKYMTDQSEGLIDYKFFCFDGQADCVMVCIDRHINDTKFYFFDKDWKLKRLNVRGKEAPSDFTLRKPECMDKMFRIAEVLSKDLKFARVDLYECNGHIYFGEITFFPDSGFDSNLLVETDNYFGELIKL